MSSKILSTHTDLALDSTARARMSGQNRFRHLNIICRVYKSAHQSINSGTPTAITFDSEVLDTDTLHDTVTNNSRLTASIAGKYYVWGICQFAGNNAGANTGQMVGFYLYKNAALESLGNFLPYPNANGDTPICTGGVVISLAASDYVEMYGYQSTGGAWNVLGGNNYNTQFGMVYIGE